MSTFFLSYSVQLFFSTVLHQVRLSTFYWKGVISHFGEWYPAACIYKSFWRMVPQSVPQLAQTFTIFVCPIERTFVYTLLFWMTHHWYICLVYIKKVNYCILANGTPQCVRIHNFCEWYPAESTATIWRMVPRRACRDSSRRLEYFLSSIKRTFFS